MSRQTKYDLKIGTITCRIGLHKSFEATTVFCQGLKGRQVRTIKVLATDDATPSTLEDIEELVPWADLDTYYPYKDEDGMMKLIPIDKKAIQALFINSSTMITIGAIDKDAIKPYMFDDAHYFINVQRDTKTKTIYGPDQKVYTVIYHYLNDKKKYLLVKFISSNREKFAVIYADPETNGLRMSLIIHSTYQRTRDVDNLVDIPDAVTYGDKLFKSFALRHVDSSEIVDDYEEKIRKYIDEYKKEGETSARRFVIKIGKAKSADVDILDQIAAMM